MHIRLLGVVSSALIVLLSAGCRRPPVDVPLKLIGLLDDRSANRPMVAVFRDSASRVSKIHEGDFVNERYRLKRVMVDAVELSDPQRPRDKIILRLTGDEDALKQKAR
jgi:hypothetical protein